MKAKLLKLKPNSRFHFGKPMIDSNTSLTDTDHFIHSDVLFSALVNNLSTIKSKEEVNQFIEGFESGAIKISSGFYCIENEKATDKQEPYLFFVPRPVHTVNTVGIEEYDKIKQVKRVSFIDLPLLDKPITDWKVKANFAMDIASITKLGISDDDLSLYQKDIATHVGIRNKSEEEKVKTGGPFKVSYISISDLKEYGLQVHFYFLYEVLDEKYESDFEIAVELLTYNGIGGERSSGYGRIEAVETITSLPKRFMEQNNTTYQLSLSKVVPNHEDISLLKYYTHSIRGGRETTMGTLKSVEMINEGAILQQGVQGNIVDISIEGNRSYLRNGKAFCIGLSNTLEDGE
ncbi:type III-A CRISPR-associated RAMP protein Csm4 [Myroides odoratimimus]|uniref:type III-A CRISPR-associated RAMP protein Csm4 n=1 Tax=Myroides odoratimimus TaxID=76832 RepID=UPI002097CCD6|nr:type III-A CRISPR-associated RAMP protein Csm4 [Myroides odoratimimus]MCO7724396.1 type III-A CRISPR-associated RAMP protein Csm4 [Myroides odoratimimus]MCS7473035.1 type III-A CRISPR-associated RAMP protein Csm4 [Myroides odoratimimus]MDM1035687.1 type III-A CRISPR-associated RAMP protein Csm4 [Myroides odoratimimus]MDM1414880.1 type III-A CRISPR-associated RAMP protein Csm4 [Myroides odoratimimus]MDM1447392.1 type III-A CRISPR-associated RAMP protein Csm4 [Myroides odoratimimus]